MKAKTVFVCQACGATSAKWMGKCPGCGEWNTLIEEVVTPAVSSVKTAAVVNANNNKPALMKNVDLQSIDRICTGISEFDEVSGGGLVPGSLILLGGEPGVGKSTLLMQLALAVGKEGKKVLYVSGEESASQVRLRSERLGELNDNIWILAENSAEALIHNAKESNCDVLIVDSIQTIYCEDSNSAPGSVSQVRQCGSMLLNFAKENNVTVILVGHVTKEGTLAGPRVLEHMVDTVLYFEGERHGALRLLRAAKNRFGSTNEIGVFEMTGEGLRSLTDPSGVFLSERVAGVAGSAIGCVMQGTRPVLLEVQALCSETAFGNPRRLASGVEYNRLLIILAVLEKKVGLRLSAQDIYVNVTGGMRVDDPALDLAIAAAVVSAYRETALSNEMVIAGEIGLTGEIRYCSQSERRVKEAAKFGFTEFMLPYTKTKAKIEAAAPSGTRLLFCKNIAQALTAMGLF